jgi:hypothetical protein
LDPGAFGEAIGLGWTSRRRLVLLGSGGECL